MYDDSTTLPAMVMGTRGAVLLVAVLPLSLPLCLVAARVAYLAKKVHGLSVKQAKASGEEQAALLNEPRASAAEAECNVERSTSIECTPKSTPNM